MSGQLDTSPELRRNLLEALRSYLDAPPIQGGRTPLEIEAALDNDRLSVISSQLGPLLSSYLAGGLPVEEFKRKIDGINKKNKLWGFSGIKGQMFFNMLLKVADDVDELETQLKSAIREPVSEGAAAAAINNFISYVTRIGQQFVDGGGDKYSKPKAGSIPFFLSYFWQVQKPQVWPVFYTNSVQVIESMNVWDESDDPGKSYVSYKHLHEALSKLFSDAAKRPLGLYDVKHVFWFKSGKLLAGASQQTDTEAPEILVMPAEPEPIQKKSQAVQIALGPPSCRETWDASIASRP